MPGDDGFEPDARLTYAASDLLQSTSAVLDLFSGKLLERGTYLPNGARETLRSHRGERFPLEPVGFTGKESDAEVGLVYFGHRYLLPHLGRWLSPDPLQSHVGGGGEFANSYHYVAGNILAARDPVGLDVTVESLENPPPDRANREASYVFTFGGGNEDSAEKFERPESCGDVFSADCFNDTYAAAEEAGYTRMGYWVQGGIGQYLDDAPGLQSLIQTAQEFAGTGGERSRDGRTDQLTSGFCSDCTYNEYLDAAAALTTLITAAIESVDLLGALGALKRAAKELLESTLERLVRLTSREGAEEVASRYSRTVFRGRRVYQNADAFDPSAVPSPSSRVHPAVRERVANGATNLDLMEEGLAPIGPDGDYVNLHHILGEEPGPMVELTAETHQRLNRQLHGLIEDGQSFRNRPGGSASYRRWRRAYWQHRAQQIRASMGE